MKTYKVVKTHGVNRMTVLIHADSEQEVRKEIFKLYGQSSHIFSVKEYIRPKKRYIVTLDVCNPNFYRDDQETHIIEAYRLPHAICEGRRLARLQGMRFIRARYIKQLNY
jgi:hypothetical protein